MGCRWCGLTRAKDEHVNCHGNPTVGVNISDLQPFDGSVRQSGDHLVVVRSRAGDTPTKEVEELRSQLECLKADYIKCVNERGESDRQLSQLHQKRGVEDIPRHSSHQKEVVFRHKYFGYCSIHGWYKGDPCPCERRK